MACNDSELTSVIMNPFGHFGRTMEGGGGGRPIAKPIPKQDR
jgi:hypothetical protein